MSTRYLPLLAGVITRLQLINPARVVTRSWDDFANRPEAQLQAGVWMVQPGGITSYPYEVSNGQYVTDSLRATENGRLMIRITGQLLLGPDVTGEQVDTAEFVLVHELEQLADDAIESDVLMALKLNHVRMSSQVDKPLAWVDSEWEVFPLT